MRCPFCNSKKTAQLSPHMFRCNTCNAHFDDEPDEGGTHSDDPVRSAIHHEAQEAHRKKRRRGRRHTPDFSRNHRFR